MSVDPRAIVSSQGTGLGVVLIVGVVHSVGFHQAFFIREIFRDLGWIEQLQVLFLLVEIAKPADAGAAFAVIEGLAEPELVVLQFPGADPLFDHRSFADVPVFLLAAGGLPQTHHRD